MKPFRLPLRSLSERETRTSPARWTKTLMSCLLVSLMWVLRVVRRSPNWLPKLTLPPNYSWAVSNSAPSFLFCQLPLSFIKGRAFWTSTERSTALPFAGLGVVTSFLAVVCWLSTAAYPSNSTFGFFSAAVRGLMLLKSPSIPLRA